MVFVLAPFGFHMLSGSLLWSALICGAAYTYASYFIYAALSHASVSRVVPIEGGLEPLFTLAFAYAFLGERLNAYELMAFALIVIGSLLLSFEKTEFRINSCVVLECMLAAGLYAASFVINKHVFAQTNFANAMIWTRLGVFLAALTYLIWPVNRKEIFAAPKQAKAKNMVLYYSAHGLGAIGGLLEYYAIAVGPVSIVNALQGTQFAFVLVLSTALSVYFPSIIKERLGRDVLAQKVTAIALISFGLFFLRT